jgi:hypothetical protein
MLSDYLLICLDCRIALYFGNVSWIDKDENPLEDVTFQGIFDTKNRQWHKRDEYFGRCLEKFLILHRNHELRFVPEGTDEILEETVGTIQEIESDELLEKKVAIEVNGREEKQMWLKRLGKEL